MRTQSKFVASYKVNALEKIDLYKQMVLSNNGTDTVEDAVCQLLEMRDYDTNSQSLRDTVVQLMGVIAKPGINQVLNRELGEYGLGKVTDMLQRLYVFFDSIKEDSVTTVLEEHELKYYSFESSRTEQEWEKVGERYGLKLDQLLLQENNATVVYK